MKTRLGFVSNSSTSSFVVIGFRYDDYPGLEENSNYYKKGFTVLQGTDDGIPEGQVVVGKQIAGWSDDDSDNKSLSQKELEEIVEQVKIFFNIPKDKQWSIYTGTCMC